MRACAAKFPIPLGVFISMDVLAGSYPRVVIRLLKEDISDG
jgi:hypothetical protein